MQKNICDCFEKNSNLQTYKKIFLSFGEQTRKLCSILKATGSRRGEKKEKGEEGREVKNK